MRPTAEEINRKRHLAQILIRLFASILICLGAVSIVESIRFLLYSAITGLPLGPNANMLWNGFTDGMPVIAIGVVLFALDRFVARLLIPIPSSACPQCKYDLSDPGNKTRCPECGLHLGVEQDDRD